MRLDNGSTPIPRPHHLSTQTTRRPCPSTSSGQARLRRGRGPVTLVFAGAVQLHASRQRRWTPACAGVAETGRLRLLGFTPQKAGPTRRVSTIVPALPLRCGSGFSRDALRHTYQKASGLKTLPQRARLWERVQPRCSFVTCAKSIGPEDPPTKSRSNAAGLDDRSGVTAPL
jgi:hypothetical protein